MANLELSERAQKLKGRVDTKAFLTHRYGTQFDAHGRAQCLFPERHNNRDANPSFSVDENRCHCWSQHCFGDKPTDIYGVIQKRDGVGFVEAVDIVAEYTGERGNGSVGIDDSRRERQPIAPNLPASNTGKQVAEYIYPDRSGNNVLMVRRLERDDGGKSFTRPQGSGICRFHECCPQRPASRS